MIEVILSLAQMRRTQNLRERIPTLRQPPMGPVVPTGIS
nr:LASS6 protein [Homo sapiens]